MKNSAAWTRLVSSALAETGDRIEAVHAGLWRCFSRDADTPAIEVRSFDDWLGLSVTLSQRAVPEADLATLFALGSRLPGLVRTGISGLARRPLLLADLPVASPEETTAALVHVYGALRFSLALVRGECSPPLTPHGLSQPLPFQTPDLPPNPLAPFPGGKGESRNSVTSAPSPLPLPSREGGRGVRSQTIEQNPSAPTPPPNLEALCRATGWTVSLHADGALAVDLEITDGFAQAQVGREADGLRITVPWPNALAGEPSGSVHHERAVAGFLLRLSATVRLARPTVDGLQITLTDPLGSDQLALAFAALSTAYDISYREVSALRSSPGLAAAYLQINQPGVPLFDPPLAPRRPSPILQPATPRPFDGLAVPGSRGRQLSQ